MVQIVFAEDASQTGKVVQHNALAAAATRMLPEGATTGRNSRRKKTQEKNQERRTGATTWSQTAEAGRAAAARMRGKAERGKFVI